MPKMVSDLRVRLKRCYGTSRFTSIGKVYKLSLWGRSHFTDTLSSLHENIERKCSSFCNVFDMVSLEKTRD